LFFLLNFFVVESRCEVFRLEDLADLYVGLAFVEDKAALDPLDGLFERFDLPEPEASDEFLAFDERAVNDGGAVLVLASGYCRTAQNFRNDRGQNFRNRLL